MASNKGKLSTKKILKWYNLKDKRYTIAKYGRYKVLEIKRKFNLEYYFYRCLVFDRGVVVASEGVHGSSLNTKVKAVRWGIKKAKELNLIP